MFLNSVQALTSDVEFDCEVQLNRIRIGKNRINFKGRALCIEVILLYFQ